MKKRLLLLTTLLFAGNIAFAAAPQQAASGAITAAVEIPQLPPASGFQTMDVTIGAINCNGRTYGIWAILTMDYDTNTFTDVNVYSIHTVTGGYSLRISGYSWTDEKTHEGLGSLNIVIDYSGSCNGTYLALIPH